LQNKKKKLNQQLQTGEKKGLLKARSGKGERKNKNLVVQKAVYLKLGGDTKSPLLRAKGKGSFPGQKREFTSNEERLNWGAAESSIRP